MATISGIDGALDGCLWLARVEAGVHKRYLEQLRFLADNLDRLPPPDRELCEVLLADQERRRWADGDN